MVSYIKGHGLIQVKVHQGQGTLSSRRTVKINEHEIIGALRSR